MRPARQGTFDGLCGIYAILNALDPAGLSARRSKLHTDLFKELTYGLGAVSLLGAMHEGLEQADLIRAGSAAFRWLSLEHQIHLSIETAYPRRRFRTDQLFIDELRQQMASKRAGLIVYLNLPGRDHWSVLSAIHSGKLLLRDSGGLASLSLKKMGAASGGWSFSAKDTLLVTRHE